MSESETPSTQPSPKPRPRLGRWLRGLLIGMLLMLLLAVAGVGVVIWQYDYLAPRLLKEYVSYRTNGLYKLDFSRFLLDLENGELHIDSLRLEIDQAILENNAIPDSVKSSGYFTLSVPNISITGFDFWFTYQHRQLNLDDIIVNHPVIKIYKPQKKSDKDTIIQKFPAVLTFLKDISLNKISIHQAEAMLYEQGEAIHHFEGMNLEAYCFWLDSAAVIQDAGFYYFDQITLRWDAHNLITKDSLYRIHFQNLVASTADSSLTVDSVLLEPIVERSAMDPDRNFYAIRAPKAVFEGLHFKDLIRHKHLNLKKASLPIANCTFYPKLDKKRPKDFYQSASKLVSQLEVGSVLLAALNLTIDTRKPGSEPIRFENADIRISYLAYDSTNYIRRQHHLFADNIGFSIPKFHIHVAKGSHVLSMGRISGSTSGQQLMVDQIRLKSVNSSPKTARLPLLDIHVPGMRLGGVDIWRLLEEDKLKCQWLKVSKPRTAILQARNPLPTADTFSLAGIYPQISNVLKEIDAKRVKVEEADFHLFDYQEDSSEVISLTDVSLEASGLLLSPNVHLDTSKFFFTDNINVRLRDLKFEHQDSLHELRVKQLDFSTTRPNIYLKGLKFAPRFPDSTARHYDISLQECHIEGFDVRKAFYDQAYSARRIRFYKPDIRLLNQAAKNQIEVPHIDSLVAGLIGEQKSYDLLQLYEEGLIDEETIDEFVVAMRQQQTNVNDLIKDLDIGLIKVIRGSFYYENHIGDQANRYSVKRFDFNLDSISIDSNAVSDNLLRFRTKDFYFKSKNHIYHLPDSLHQITIDKIQTSYLDSSLHFQNISIKPKDSVVFPASASKFDYEIPKLGLEGINYMRLYEDEALHLRKLFVHKPFGRLGLGNGHDGSGFALDALPEVVGRYLRELRVDSVVIDSGFQSAWLADGHLMAAQGVDVLGLGLDLSEGQRMSERFLFADDWQVQIGKVWHNQPITKHKLYLEGIKLSDSVRRLEVRRMALRPDLPNRASSLHREPFIWVEAEGFRLTASDPYLLYLADSVVLDSVLAEAVMVRNLPDFERTSPPPSLDTLIASLQHQIPFFQIKNAGCKRIDFHQATEDDAQNVIWNQWHLSDARIEQLKIDEDFLNDERIYHTDQITFDVIDIHQNISNGLYELAIDTVSVATKDSSLLVKGLYITPNYDSVAFFDMIGYQSDWILASVFEIRFQQLDFPALLRSGDFKTTNMGIHRMKLHLYRDKRLDEPPYMVKELPQVLLQSLERTVKVDTLVMNASEITYSEQVENSPGPGSVTLHDLSVNAFNITNDSLALRRNRWASTHASASIMGAGNMSVDIIMDLKNPMGYHRVEGTLGEMHLEQMNPMLENVAFVRIKQGALNKEISFEFEADDSISYGRMRFKYTGLHVTFLDKKSMTPTLKDYLVGIMANTFVVLSKNPRLLLLRDGRIYYRRNEEKSIVNFWVKSFLSGVKTSVGIRLQKDAPPAGTEFYFKRHR